MASEAIFLAYDQDEAGRKGAKKLSNLSQHLVAWSPPQGDLIDFHRAGGDVRVMMAEMRLNVDEAESIVT